TRTLASTLRSPRNLSAGASRLGQSDRNCLLAAFHLFARATAMQFATLHLVHGAFDFFRRFLAVSLRHRNRDLITTSPQRYARLMPPSRSCRSVRHEARRELFDYERRERLHEIVECFHLREERFELVQRQRARTIALRFLGLRMAFEEEPRDADGDARTCEFDDLAASSTRSGVARLALLQCMRDIEDDRHIV